MVYRMCFLWISWVRHLTFDLPFFSRSINYIQTGANACALQNLQSDRWLNHVLSKTEGNTKSKGEGKVAPTNKTYYRVFGNFLFLGGRDVVKIFERTFLLLLLFFYLQLLQRVFPKQTLKLFPRQKVYFYDFFHFF